MVQNILPSFTTNHVVDTDKTKHTKTKCNTITLTTIQNTDNKYKLEQIKTRFRHGFTPSHQEMDQSTVPVSCKCLNIPSNTWTFSEGTSQSDKKWKFQVLSVDFNTLQDWLNVTQF